MKMHLSWSFVIIFIGFCILDSGGIPTNSPKLKIDTSAEDDSDMLMEPDELSHIAVVKSEGTQIYPTTTEIESYEHPSGPDSHSQAAQNFYPPFFRESPPLGHSRPYYGNQENPIQASEKYGNNRALGPSPATYDQAILGSGDFGVIRGGTFYSEDETPYQNDDANEYNYFFGDNPNSNNGHGRPHAEAYVQKFTYPEEQFANFRDFADINTPADSAFSQFVIVYANKNSTSESNAEHSNPKNIFEQLQLLDKEKAMEEKKNRISKAKAKLANTKLEKKYKKKAGPKDLEYEPLLALS